MLTNTHHNATTMPCDDDACCENVMRGSDIPEATLDDYRRYTLWVDFNAKATPMPNECYHLVDNPPPQPPTQTRPTTTSGGTHEPPVVT